MQHHNRSSNFKFRICGGIPESSRELRIFVGSVVAFWSGTVSIDL